MHLLLLAALSVSFMVCYYAFQKPLIVGIATGMFLFLTGAQMYTDADAINDIYYLGGIFIILMGMLYWWEVFTSYASGRKEDRQEWLIENLEELKDDYEDALDNEDYALASKIKSQIKEARDQHEMFALTPETNVRKKVQDNKNRKYWKQFDEDGRL